MICLTYHCDGVHWIDNSEQQYVIGLVVVLALTARLVTGGAESPAGLRTNA